MFKFFRNLFGIRSTVQLTYKYNPPNPNGIPPDYGDFSLFRCKEKVGHATFWAAKNGIFHLDKIDVAEEHRGKGYGTKMIKFLFKEAEKMKCTFFVFHGVNDKNILAIKLYTRLGAVQGQIIPTGKHDYVKNPPF